MKQNPNINKLVQLELRSVKNRMNPHFIFNVMSTLSNLVLNGDKMIAYDCILKFSGLLRETMVQSEWIALPLKEELSMVQKYLDLQSIRFSTKFDFMINIHPEVNLSQKVPKSCVITYVEEALKHGLFHRKKGGLLQVNIYNEGDCTIMEILDNGIGVKGKGKKSIDSITNGLAIMDEYFAIFNQHNENKLKIEILELSDKQGKITGSKVQVSVPKNLIIPSLNAKK